MEKNKKRQVAKQARRKIKVSTNNCSSAEHQAKQPIITRFYDEPVHDIQIQVLKATTETASEDKKKTSQHLALDMVKVNKKMRERTNRQNASGPKVSLSAKEIKEREIEKAISTTNRSIAQKRHRHHYRKMDFGFRRVMLAMTVAAVSVFAIVYFVNSNAPDMAIKVAAMQTGIKAHCPGYIPRDYSLSDATSEDGKMTLNFKNSTTDGAFSLVEEKTDWRADDLYANFIKPTYGENYVVVSDSGFNVYISGSNAAWTRDGIFYKITTTSGSLTKKQLSTIVANLDQVCPTH